MIDPRADRERQDETLFNRISGRYARKDTVRSSMIPRKRLLLEAIGPLVEDLGTLGTVLDIGCGTGAPARYLQGLYGGYIGVDQSQKMIESARVLNQDIPSARFVAGNIKSIDLPPRSVDFVLSLGALHHMTDLESVMQMILRLVRSNGHILVIEPQNANPLIQILRRFRMRLDPHYSRDQLFFSQRELVALLEKYQVKILSCRYMGFFSTPLAEVILNPQFLFVPVSRLLSSLDSWLYRRLPGGLKKLAYKLVVTGRFD